MNTTFKKLKLGDKVLDVYAITPCKMIVVLLDTLEPYAKVRYSIKGNWYQYLNTNVLKLISRKMM